MMPKEVQTNTAGDSSVAMDPDDANSTYPTGIIQEKDKEAGGSSTIGPTGKDKEPTVEEVAKVVYGVQSFGQ